MQQLRELDSFDAIARLTDDLHVRLHREQQRRASAHDW
jgi:hypothetical protein